MKYKTLKSFSLAAILLLGFSFALAQNTPEAMVKELYKTHDQDLAKNKERILSGKNRKLLDKFFEKTLADLMWKDLTSNSDEVGVLDFDPFYNAQDFDIRNFLVSPAKVNGTKATVTVKFQNFDRKDTLIYHLIKHKSNWRITDIKYNDGSSLLGYFEEDAKKKETGQNRLR